MLGQTGGQVFGTGAIRLARRCLPYSAGNGNGAQRGHLAPPEDILAPGADMCPRGMSATSLALFWAPYEDIIFISHLAHSRISSMTKECLYRNAQCPRIKFMVFFWCGHANYSHKSIKCLMPSKMRWLRTIGAVQGHSSIMPAQKSDLAN